MHDSHSQIKAIQTSYKGFLFRSRLEARWALFYDTLGIKYEYEPEGYSLKSGPYLPDFYLPDYRCFVEIKPAAPGALEYEKAADLATMTGIPVLMFWDGIPYPDGDQFGSSSDSAWIFYPAEAEGEQGGWDNNFHWCECVDCSALGIEFDGRAERLKHVGDCPGAGRHKNYAIDTPRLMSAYKAARSARFEFGQTPIAR